MRTDDLVAMLASGADAVESHTAARRFAVATGCGALGASLLMAVLLGVRHDLGAAALLPMFWVKVAFVACLAGSGLLAVSRLSRPGLRLAWASIALAVPVMVMWPLATAVLIRADPLQRAQLFFGETWTSCPILIALLSTPALFAVLWAMRGLAPTRPALAGAAAGLLSGAIGALVYCLHCPETAAPFVAFWYLIGMLIPSAIGALIGPRLLRW